MNDQVRRTVTVDEGVALTAIGGTITRLIHPATVPDTQHQVSLCTQEPGEVVVPHRHAVEEIYFVVSGTGIMVLEGHPRIDLAPGMAVHIPSGAIHGQRATGDERLVIVCSLSPPLTDAPELVEDPKYFEALAWP